MQPADGGFVVAAGAVELTAKNGSDIYVEELRAPMLLREPGGNFTIETDVTAAPEQFYQGAGLLLWNGSRATCGWSAGSATSARSSSSTATAASTSR